MNEKAALVLGFALAATGIVVGFIVHGKKQPPTPPPPGPGPAAFEISVVNLPEGATSWGCAFKDPATGTFYQPTNHPATGVFTFGPSEVAELDVPVSSGVLSISAFSGVSLSTIVQIQNFQVQINVADGGKYVFDFLKGGLL